MVLEDYDKIAHKIRFDPEFDILKHGADVVSNCRLNEV